MPEDTGLRAPEENFIKNAMDFYTKIKDQDKVTVKFIKKDGTERTMKCTLNFKYVPHNKKPKDVNMAQIIRLITKSGIIHVYDLEKKDWRSVPFNKVEWLETGEEAQADRTRFFIRRR
jgi:hypothetical protein